MTTGRLLAATALIVIAVEAGAGTWRVGRDPGDCPGGCNFHDQTPGGGPGRGILSAMSDLGVLPGDTVRVWPGEYGSRFEMKSGVVLESVEGADVTIIRGSSGTTPGVTFAGTNASTVVDGFTIRWGAGSVAFGGGVGGFAASGTVKNCVFRFCSAGLGSGVYLQSSNMIIENNVFTRNQTISGGGTISISGGTPTIRNNSFHVNEIPFGQEGVDVYAVGSDFTFEHNIVADARGGVGVFCAGAQNATIGCNIVWNAEFGAFGGTCGDAIGTSGNVSMDPLFCDPPSLDFGVCLDSPALGTACGPIGYQSPGGNCLACAPTPVSEAVQSLSWGRVKALYK
jgi:hypothetical protein